MVCAIHLMHGIQNCPDRIDESLVAYQNLQIARTSRSVTPGTSSCTLH